MVSHTTVALIAFLALGVVLIGAWAANARLRQKFSPNLIGALAGALMCFLLLETIPALI